MSRLGNIKGVIFDFDGTLSDSLIAITGIINAMRAERGAVACDANHLRPFMSLAGEDLVKGCLDQAARTPADDLADFRRRYALVEPDTAHLFPGTLAMLDTLRQAGLRCAICSNKPHDILVRFLEGMGLDSYFEVVVGGDAARKGKPDPEMLFYTLEKMGWSAHETVLVGDSEADALAAQMAQIPFILVSFGYGTSALEAMPYHARIDQLDQLPNLLSQMRAPPERSP